MKKKLSCLLMALLMVGCLPIVPFLPAAAETPTPKVEGDANRLSIEKTEFVDGEPIMISAVGTGTDWVGIYTENGTKSVRWTYIDTAQGGPGSGVKMDLREAARVNQDEPTHLPAGNYIIRVMPEDTMDVSLAVASVKIRVVNEIVAPDENPDEPPVIMGDADRLTVSKRQYIEGEPIMISGVGEGTDWLGIYTPDGTASIRWIYIAEDRGGPGSGKEVDIRSVPEVNPKFDVNIPAGTYIIRLMPEDKSDLSLQVAWTTITVRQPDAIEPVKPLSVTYHLDHDTDGYAAGEVTVEMAEEIPYGGLDVFMYWANDEGKLPGYGRMSKFKLDGKKTVHRIPEGILIPEGATRLLVYTHSGISGQVSEEYVSLDLPAGAAKADFGKPICSLNIISDIHLCKEANHLHNRQFKIALEELTRLNPDSIGTFIVGDMADTGDELEYQYMWDIHGQVEGAAPIYLAVGNHDLLNGTMKEKTDLFCKNAILPDGSHPTSTHYDFWLNGYHFVFLGNDLLVGCKTTLNSETIEWLDTTLAENYDPSRPTFIFLHQSLYDTVAGSLPGQGWNGVANEKGLREVLAKYPEALLFNGHSHWIMNSERNMYRGDPKLPTIFNTSATSYLWTSYDIVSGENYAGAEGYVVDIYEDKVVLRGRNFLDEEWFPSAQYCVEYDQSKPAPEETTSAGTETTNAPSGETTMPETTAVNPGAVDTAKPAETTANEPATTEAASSGCHSSAGLIGGISAIAATTAGALLLKKKRRD